MQDFDFVILGLASCWRRDEDNLLTEIKMIEPIPSAAFLTLVQGVPSSFEWVTAVDPNPLLNGQRPQGFPSEAIIPQDFQERLLAAARTFQHQPIAKTKLQIGEVLNIQHPTKDKRIINHTHVVNDEDNIKQHQN